ncbi:MAG: flagellar basal-body MS-ring/collar protein FliF [bacterium]|jgi:flagellar M-ring protein FliF
MAGLPEVKAQVLNTWGALDKGTKIKLAIVLVLTLLLIIAFTISVRPSYEVLFANLAAADAGEITARLEDINVSYRLTDNGSTILVPEGEVYRVRNQLIMEGLPQGGTVDFGIFDEARLGATDFERRVQYRRALQGELTRTIMAMSGVKNAWVQISLPEPRLYQTQEEKASAAILIENRGELSPVQVQGIINLVSHSVEGLQPEMVTVVNTKGEVLSQQLEQQNILGLTTNQLDLRRQIERELEQGLRTMLEMVIGIGKVVTRVSADIDFNQKEITTQHFDPGQGDGILRSIQELERSFHGGEYGAGVPGATANIPGIPTYQAIEDNESVYYERETVKNFEINEIQEHLVIAPGSINKLSVAVLVDAEELNQEQRLAIEESVIAAVGVDYTRGDQISVTALPFVSSPFEEFTDVADTGGRSRVADFSYGLGGGLLLCTGLLILLLLRRRRLHYQMALAQEAAATREEENTIYSSEQQVIQQMERVTRQRPEVIAQLLSTWLHEE